VRSTRANNKPGKRKSDESGVALFMVIGAVSILALLVTEFTYVAQMNEQLAFDAMDGVKALYLAKSAVKLSLLRLKAYQTVMDLVGGGSSNGKNSSSSNSPLGGLSVPHSILDKIWSFPFMFPLPTNIPGMLPSEKDKIEKFQKESNFEGSFSSLIESESARLNINSILPQFAPSSSPSPSASPSAVPPGTQPAPQVTTANPSPQPSYDPTAARQSLAVYFQNLINSKSEDDPDFGTDYRDFKVEDFMDQVTGWSDPTYESKNGPANSDSIPQKHAPFYSLSELHMIDGMDDTLYDVFTPGLTASKTPGLDINTMNQTTLKALVPLMTAAELTDFFKYRDDDTTDNSFKSSDDFYSYLENSVAAYKGNSTAISQLKEDLAKRNIILVTDETEFKITVSAQVGNASRKIEVWVRLRKLSQAIAGPGGSTTTVTAPAAAPNASPTPVSGGAVDGSGNPMPDPGIKIIYMRIS
jgi:type II secretory pathway component PulK